MCMQCANIEAQRYLNATTETTTDANESTKSEPLTTYVIDYEDMPYETEYDAEYIVDWNQMDSDIRRTEEMRYIQTTYDNSNYDRNPIGEYLYINGEDRTVLISAKEYLLKNIRYFDISPLKPDSFRDLRICRIGSFPSQEGGVKKINLCYKPQSYYYNQSPFITSIESKRFGNCEIRFEVEHKVASISLYIALGIVAVALVIGLLVKGTKMGYKKFVSMRAGTINNDYQHI